jgi:HEAT repeat protein
MAAFSELLNLLWHQGHVFEASMYAIPFLVELLESADVPNKSMIVVLIGEIATGKTSLQAVKGDGANWEKILAKHGKSLLDELAKEELIEAGIRRKAGEALEILKPYLCDPDSTVRRIVADVLSLFPEYRANHTGLLRNALELESDPFVIRDIQGCIDRLALS